VLGGPIGIYEVDRYPFLRHELSAIEAAIKRGTPVLGICLGAQALAAVLAARVYPNRQKELGWAKLALTKDGASSPLGALAEAPVLHWHGDTFDLPRGATLLASTDLTSNQAFAYESKILALQFHAELLAKDLERWLIGHALELAHAGVDLAKLRSDTARLAPAANAASRRLFSAWLDTLSSAATARSMSHR
jgi:GMP synthase (glutamine-hydrolysing)